MTEPRLPRPAVPRRTFLQGASAALAAGFAPGSVLLGTNAKTKNPFAVLPEDMQGHMHIVGASGKGKSNFLEVMLRQLILQADGIERGLCVIDPHGQMVDSLVEWVADNRVARYRTVRVIDASDPTQSFSFSPFSAAAYFDDATLAELLAKATMQTWGADRLTDTPRLTTVLTETYYALSVNRATLLEATDLLRAEDPHGLRRHFVRQLPNEVSRSFWEDLDGATPARRHELLESTWSRLRPFLRSPAVRRIFGAAERTIDLRAAMDAGEIVLISLRPSEHLSPEAARLIGTLLVTSSYTAGFTREKPELPFYLCLDEAQLFLTPDIARILDQSRKYGIRLVLSHQHMGHLREVGEAIMRSVLTNCRVRAVFGGLDADDACFMARNVFRGQWDYERPKMGFLQPMVVGVRLTRVHNGSETLGTVHSDADSKGGQKGKTRTRTITINDGGSEQTVKNAQGDVVSVGRTQNDGGSIADTEGDTDGTNWSRVTTDGATRQVVNGFGEVFKPEYRMRPTQLLSVEEQIQQRADALARLPVGQMWVQIAERRPRRIKVAYLGEKYVLPELAERVRRELLAATPYVRTAKAADEAHAAHRARLIALAKPAEPPATPDGFADVAAKLRRRRKADDGDAEQGSGDGVG